MSFICNLRFLPVASLLIQVVLSASSETCYYPDGKTVSTVDVPCNVNSIASSCCPSDSFCMGNGLCFRAGITSRASCTDQDWNSAECASYCTSTDNSTTVSLTPCDADTDTFVCGLNNTDCRSTESTFEIDSGTSLVLRQSEVSALIAISDGAQGQKYSAGAMAGVALGLSLPLLCALIVALVSLSKERRKNVQGSLYKSADEPDVHLSSVRPKHDYLSRSESTTSFHSTSKHHYDRNTDSFMSERDLGVPVYEMESSSPPYSESERVGVPEKTFSR